MTWLNRTFIRFQLAKWTYKVEQRAWFILARSFKTKPFLNVPPNLSYQDGSVSLLTACFIGPVVNLVWRGILNPARAPSKLNSTLPKSWNRKCNWWPPLVGDLTCGPGFQTIGIWLQSALSADGKKRETSGVWEVSQKGELSQKLLRRLPTRLVCMTRQSIGLSEKEKAGVWKQWPLEGHISRLFRTHVHRRWESSRESKWDFVVFKWEGKQINI